MTEEQYIKIFEKFNQLEKETKKEIDFLKEEIHLLKMEICDLKNCSE